MTFSYLEDSDLILPDGFTNWDVYWERKGPSLSGPENAKAFLKEKGCFENSRKRWRLSGRKWDDVDPEIRRAVDFLSEKGLSRGWTTRILKLKPKPPKAKKLPKPPPPKKEKKPSGAWKKLIRAQKRPKKLKIKFKYLKEPAFRIKKIREKKQKIVFFREASPPKFENDCE